MKKGHFSIWQGLMVVLIPVVLCFVVPYYRWVLSEEVKRTFDAAKSFYWANGFVILEGAAVFFFGNAS